MTILITTTVFGEARAELWVEVPIIQEIISTPKSRPQLLHRICMFLFPACWGIEKRPAHEPNVYVERSNFWPADASLDSNILVFAWGAPLQWPVKRQERRHQSYFMYFN